MLVVERMDEIVASSFTREPLAEGVARSLAQYITTARMRPGDSLKSETELAQMFKVSMRTVREAIRILTEQGIVSTSQGKRAMVSNGRPRALKRSMELARLSGRDALADLLELRFTIEPRAAALAALRHSPSDVEVIEKALKGMREVSMLSDTDAQIDAWVDNDISFHDAIVRAAHNTYFEMVMGAVSESLLDERTTGVRNRIAQGRTQDATLCEHSSILEAIRVRDEESAQRLMLEHLEQSLTYFWGMPQSSVFSVRPFDGSPLPMDIGDPMEDLGTR